MSKPGVLSLFQGFGVEMEYMIVDAESLAVKPITDKVIYEQVGSYVSDVVLGPMAWSNELVLHVIELKTNGPAPDLTRLPNMFQEQINRINEILKPYGARLLPTGMHPLMNPFTDTQLWPHEYNAVYEAYNRIFDCRGHGWSNLQSTHLNLPFADDEEFGRLHAAIRLILPLIPALSASSPVMDGQITDYNCTRLEVYRQNQSKIPQIAGDIIPEAVFTRAAYEKEILEPAYRAIAPYDPEEILHEEFLNSRGAIARFERNAIEIRIIDNQENPMADLAILQLVVWVLQLLVSEKWVSLDKQKAWPTGELAAIYHRTVKHGLQAEIANPEYLSLFNFSPNQPVTAKEIWMHLLNQIKNQFTVPPALATILEIILEEGNLSDRIKKGLGAEPTPEKIKAVYSNLADCLATRKMYRP